MKGRVSEVTRPFSFAIDGLVPYHIVKYQNEISENGVSEGKIMINTGLKN